ncbi:MAG: hypothetical protein FWG82_03930 [Oscillospiraceae bacterium]|nr:hypothetical protein [Oscillospiraceae bacterium]
MKHYTTIRKVLVFIVVLTACISVAAATVSGWTEEVDPEIKKSMEEAEQYIMPTLVDVTDPKYTEEGDKRDLLIDDPDPIFKPNPDLDKYFDINTVIDQEALAAVNAVVTLKEVMKYSDYTARFDDGEEITAIAPERLVWVLQVYYPKGFETKRGVYSDATVTGLYDAETGFYHGFSLSGTNENPILPGRR